MASQAEGSMVVTMNAEVMQRISLFPKVYLNLPTGCIIADVNAIENTLLKFEKQLKAGRDWIAPLSLFLSIAATLATASFKDFLGLAPEVWQAMYIMALIFSCVWLTATGRRAYGERKRATINEVMDALKKETVEVRQEVSSPTSSPAPLSPADPPARSGGAAL